MSFSLFPAKRSAFFLAFGIVLCSLAVAQDDNSKNTGYVSPPEKLPRRVPPQPLPFSHKTHAANNLRCVDCHKTAGKRMEAGMPQPADCMVCHQTIATGDPGVQKLTQVASVGLEVYWVPVYDVPAFVFFHHRQHVKAGFNCQTCHGDVTQYDVLVQEMSVSMTACMNCHKQQGAANECYICHELGQ